MTGRARLIFAPAVRKELPPQVIEQARSTLNAYTCVGCGGPGDARKELTSVIVVKPPNFPPVIRCAHATCVQSHVSQAPPVNADNIGPASVTYQKVMYAWNRGGQPVVMPTMLVDYPTNFVEVTAGGDRMSLDLQFFLDDGFELAMAPDQPFPEVTGYTVVLKADGSGRIDQPPGRPGAFLEEFNDDNPGGLWHAAVRQRGALTLMVTVGLGLAGTPDEQVESALSAAVKSGNVVGGRIRVVEHS
ncbi:hypothetical protein P5V34_11615 [Mycobacteroides abscessus subsp. abscessus]|jgi:hypothetical protein|uniref:hypothetical protein n=1 Tax=Mycobacteroides abscessus TaxID=36809 RepID=UPI00266BEA40|nr:hypothetical protein [Mycobacteroides abscessus]MDO3014634.1 hypothetical protein [Mycobacteroides abscessus subsp. abscessus]